LKSRPVAPHPLFREVVKAVIHFSEEQGSTKIVQRKK